MKKLILLFLLSIVSETSSQTLSVFGLDTSSYPGIKTKLFVFDSTGKLIRNFKANDFKLTENGLEAAISLSSPTNIGNVEYSLVFSFDVSKTMGVGDMKEIPITNAMRFAARLTDSCEMPPSDIALQTSNAWDGVKLLQNYSAYKAGTINKINSINYKGDKNIRDQLLDPENGLIKLAKEGTNKRIAILMTDGRDIQLTDDIINACIDSCKKYNITFYAIAFTRRTVEPNGVKHSLWKIATETGGLFIDGMSSLESSYELARTFSFILKGYEPYTIEWQSVYLCKTKLMDVELILLKNNKKTGCQYRRATESLPILEFEPPSVVFTNCGIGKSYDTTITVTARNVDFKVSDINSSDAIFSISPKSFNLAKNQSKQIVISYTPSDSSSTSTEFNLVTDQCNHQYNAGGTYYQNYGPRTLRLTSPNGGEIYGIGADTLIRWEGIPERDTVRLEYSKDSGATWILITDKASGLSYRWKGLPSPEGDKYMIRIKQLSPTGLDSVPSIQWQKRFGGLYNDMAEGTVQTKDGGYVVLSSKNSNNWIDFGLMFASLGAEIRLNKYDSAGNKVWEKLYGTNKIYYQATIQLTNDGGFIIAGNTRNDSVDKDIIPEEIKMFESLNIFILRLDSNGTKIWEKIIGGSKADGSIFHKYYKTIDIKSSDDGGFLVVGSTESYDGDVSGNHGGSDIWVVKLSSTGNIQWQKCLGGIGNEEGTAICKSPDGGCLVCGYANTIDGDVSGCDGGWDIWLIKLDVYGNIMWKKTYGGSGNDIVLTATGTKDGGYIIGGGTQSDNGDFSEHQGGSWLTDMFVMKLNSKGDIQWQKTYGEHNEEFAYSIVEMNDGGFLIGGYTNSYDHDGYNIQGWGDADIIKINSRGILIWEKYFGGSSPERALSTIPTMDNGILFVGGVYSTDGDLINAEDESLEMDNMDAWVVKLHYDKSVIQSDTSDNVFSIIKPKMESFDIDFGKAVVDGFKDSIITEFIKNTGSVKFRIDSIYFKGERASYFSIINTTPPFEIEPSSAADIVIRYQPKESGYHDVEIVMITQTDTLVQWVWAQAIPPVLSVLDKKIDFRNVFVGIAKEAKGTVTVKNVTKEPLAILDTRLEKLGNPDFTILAGGGKFTLKPGDTCRLDLQFLPSKPGRVNCYIEFHYNGIGSPVLIELTGRGVDTKPEIDISGSARFCENEDVTLTTTEEFLNYKWSTGDKARSINIHEPGTYSVSGEYASGKWNQSDNYYAVRTENVYETESLTGTSKIDFGEVPTGEIFCKEFSIKNIRTFDVLLSKINLINNNSFSVPISQFPKLLNPGEEQQINLCFKSLKPGYMTDTLVITDSCFDHKLFLSASSYGEAYDLLNGGSLSPRRVINNNSGQAELVIFEPYPNPVFEKSFITLVTLAAQNISIVLYDNLGNSTSHIYEGGIMPGVLNEFEIDALLLDSGVYNILISGDSFIESVPIVVLK